MKHLRVNPFRFGQHAWVSTCGRAVWGLSLVWRLSDVSCRDCKRDNDKVNGTGYVGFIEGE